jgi:hypothetical protein
MSQQGRQRILQATLRQTYNQLRILKAKDIPKQVKK